MPEDVNKAGFSAGIDNYSLLERHINTPFKKTFNEIDNVLFPPDGTYFIRGFRNTNVRYLEYLAGPFHQSVPLLIDDFCNKVTEIRRNNDLNVNSNNKLELAAWALWVVLAIHPKKDGNGRLGKAIAEVIHPTHKLMDFRSPLWDRALDHSRDDIVTKVSQITGKPVPGIFFDSVNGVVINISDLEKAMSDFYTPDGEDLVTDILSGGIERTGINSDGVLVLEGPSKETLSLFKKFIEESPRRKKYLSGARKVSFVDRIKRLIKR